MKLKERLTRICGEENCREECRCQDCFDKLVAWREIEYMITAFNEISKAQHNSDSKNLANEILDSLKKAGQI
jgi:hypothetical protein